MYPRTRFAAVAALAALFFGFAPPTIPRAWSAAPASGERRTTIPVVYVNAPAQVGGAPTGGFMLVDVRVADNARRVPVVACSMSRPGAANDSWQASAWVAAFAAARETRHRMLEYEYYVNAPEPIEGPSAGMLLSATMLSLIKNVPVLPNRTLTGSVNPDGTIGPVGGIVSKLSAAQKAGVTRFGFPVGQRLEFSDEEKKYVDVIVRARQFGMEAVELRDINDAYVLLTGQKTGVEVDTVPSVPPVLSQVAADRIRAGYLRSHEQFAAKFEETVALYNSTKPRPALRERELQASLESARHFDADAVLFHDAGTLTASYLRELNALTQCESVNDELQAIRRANAKGSPKDKVKGSVDALLEIRAAAQQAREALQSSIQENLTSQSMVLRLESLNAYINLREGFAHELAGDRLVNTAIQQSTGAARKGSIPDGFEECVSKACLYYALAKTRFVSSLDFYSAPTPRARNEDVALRLTPEFEQSIGDAYSQGSQAALAFLNTAARGKWRSQVKEQLSGRNLAEGFQPGFEDRVEAVSFVDPSYLPNEIAVGYDPRRPDSTRSALADLEGDQWKFAPESSGNLDSFGSGATAYLGLSSLVLQYYNYSGQPERMAHSRSYGIFLDLARSKALDGARRLEEQMRKEIGNTASAAEGASLLPTAIVLNLDLADSLRYGNVNDKVLCLKVYWRVSLLCDLALDMIRQSKS